MAAAGVLLMRDYLKGALMHDRIAVARAPEGAPPAALARQLRGTTNNILYVPRPAARAAAAAAVAAPSIGSGGGGGGLLRGRQSDLPPPRAFFIDPDAPDKGAEALAAAAADAIFAGGAPPSPALAAAVAADAAAASAAIFGALPGARRLRARLEVITKQSCPKWHADFVGLRALCTYDGPGTLFVPNSHVTRKWTRDGTVSVGEVDEAAAEQAEPWDLLFLKGNGFPGLYGMGAVHRSPEGASAAAPRLLLTIDDVCDCCM